MKYNRSGPHIGVLAEQKTWFYLEFNEHGLSNILVGDINFGASLAPFWFECTSISIPQAAKFRLFSFAENAECLGFIYNTRFHYVNTETHYIGSYKNNIVPEVKYLEPNHKLRLDYQNLPSPKITEQIYPNNFKCLQTQYANLQQFNQARAGVGAQKALELLYCYYFHLDGASFPQTLLQLYDIEQAFWNFNANQCTDEDYNLLDFGVHLCKKEAEGDIFKPEMIPLIIQTDALNIQAKIVSEMHNLIRSPSSVSVHAKLGVFSTNSNMNLNSISNEIAEVGKGFN